MSPEFELPQGEVRREIGRVGFVGQSQISCNSLVYVPLQTQSCLRFRKNKYSCLLRGLPNDGVLEILVRG